MSDWFAISADLRDFTRRDIVRKQLYEGLCHDHRVVFKSDHLGTYLARPRRRVAPYGRTLVGSHHYRRRSLPLGFALALALAVIVTVALDERL